MTDTPTPESSSDLSQDVSTPFDFEKFFAEAEQKLQALKVRRQSIEQGKTRYDNLRNLQVDPGTLEDIKTTEEIEMELEKIEYGLATEIIEIIGEENLAWKGSGEGFWTFFRYAGIGFAIAVILHQFVG